MRGRAACETDERVEELRGDELNSRSSFSFTGDKLTKIESRTFEIVAKLDLKSAESMTTTVLASEDGMVGVPITFDGFRLWVDDEFIPLYGRRTRNTEMRVIVDRSVVIAFVNGKSLTKTVTPPVDELGYADNVILSTLGSRSSWSRFSAYSLGD